MEDSKNMKRFYLPVVNVHFVEFSIAFRSPLKLFLTDSIILPLNMAVDVSNIFFIFDDVILTAEIIRMV